MNPPHFSLRMIPTAVILALGFAGVPVAAAPVGNDATWVAKWREDILFAKTQFPKAHVKLFHTLSRDAFESELDSLAGRLPALAHHEIVVELARIIARVGDGHTRLTLPVDPAIGLRQGHTSTPAPKIEGLVFRQYPIRLAMYEDGLHVRRIDARHAEWAGARVVRIGRMSADEAVEAVSEIVHRDNAMGVLRRLPDYMGLAEVLHARRVVSDMQGAAFVLRRTDGRETTLRLNPVATGREVKWVDARDRAGLPAPRYLTRPGEHFWFEELQPARALYLQYNMVANEDDETTADFAERLEKAIASPSVERVIIDLRNNDGGDNSLNRPILHALIRSRKLDTYGRLHVLIGRETFSAAVMFASDLERHTRALFAGEPTGGSPNGYGDSRKVRLPNSGITVRLSTIEWQYSDPLDDRPWIAPHVRVPMTSADYAGNRDPILDAVLAAPAPIRELAGTWEGTFHPSPHVVYSFAVRLTPDGGAWRGSLSVKGTDLEDLPLDDVRVEPSGISFVWKRDGGDMDFQTTLAGDRAIGRARLRGLDRLVLMQHTATD